MLEGGGYEVLSASNAETGLAKARHEKPDLILMDVLMPGMNGFQATRRLAKDPETAGIPIIVVTTKSQETDRIWALRQGARDYVVKPPVEAELLSKIKALLKEH
jgi:twitching motility two-component system response regulator PilH